MSFWCLQFFQRMNENNSTWGTIVVGSIFFVHFWKNWRYVQKRHFEINWPLDVYDYNSIDGFGVTVLDLLYVLMCHIGAISHGYISTRAKKPFHTIAFTGCIHRVHCHISICTSLLNPIFICTFSPQNHTESSQDMHQKNLYL